MMMYAAVILLCSVLATNAKVVADENADLKIADKDVQSPSTIEDVDDISMDVAKYDQDGDDDESLVDQIDDIKMADELMRDMETGKVRDVKDPFIVSSLLAGGAALSRVRWGSRRRSWTRRRRGRW